jgi:hypothetical protein
MSSWRALAWRVSSPSSQNPEGYRFEFLPDVAEEGSALSEELRTVVAGIVVDLHSNPWRGALMDERWPEHLAGSRNVRFDEPGWKEGPAIARSAETSRQTARSG